MPKILLQSRTVKKALAETLPAGTANEALPPITRDATVSVVIPAYSLDRWPLTRKAVESIRTQSRPVTEVVVCIDHNEELLELASREWKRTSGTPVRVLPNRHHAHLEGRAVHAKAHGENRRFGAGSARNTAAETVTADIVAFMDDDAWAENDWIERLVATYEQTDAVAVGGPPLPDYEGQRPAWYPDDFDWVFGCAYAGLPNTTAPVRRLIGANMSVRNAALQAIGGFHVYEFDDLDLCMRIAGRYGEDRIYYEPRAKVHHYVPRQRVTWRYFWRRCYFVNREKVRAFRGMGNAANLAAEREFISRSARRRIRDAARGLRRRDTAALKSLGAMLLGVALAAAGHLRGRLDNSTRAAAAGTE
jgi:GT2 family glycosyltransferase